MRSNTFSKFKVLTKKFKNELSGITGYATVILLGISLVPPFSSYGYRKWLVMVYLLYGLAQSILYVLKYDDKYLIK